MSDRDALLAAIMAQPDEDTPRLAFADWLDEHGDANDRSRAELIRAQCELVRLERDDVGQVVPLRELLDDPRHPTAARRGQLGETVERLHEAVWTAEAARLPKLDGTEWRKVLDRGFACAATFGSGEAFACAARSAFSAAPVREVAFRWLGSDDAAAAAASPWLDRVRALELYSPINAAGAVALARTGRVGGVASVWMPQPLTATVIALVRSGPWSGIESLTVDNATGGDHILRALAASPLRERLTRLKLSHCRVTADGASALASVAWPRLRVLCLPNNEIGEGGTALAQSSGFPRLEHLDLSDAGLTLNAIAALRSSTTLSRLWHLNVP